MADVFHDWLEGCLERLSERHGSRVDVPEEHKFFGSDACNKAIELADAVILATPPDFMPAYFEASVEAGKHYLWRNR